VTSLGQLLLELVDQLPAEAGGPADGVRVAITTVEMDLPLESRLIDGSFAASLPRGRWRSGVEMPQGALFARWERTAG
jgi:hypothetical protein